MGAKNTNRRFLCLFLQNPPGFPRRSRSISSCLGISTEQGVCLAASWWNARRHSGCDVTTAAIDNLQFKSPAYAGDTVILNARLTYAGRTSMEVRVDTYVESLQGARRLINTAYLVMVALDAKGNPAPVPPLQIETEEQKLEYEAAALRKEFRKKRRAQGY